MAEARVLVGQFIGRRGQSPDTSESPLSEGDGIVAGKSFLDIDLPNSDLVLTVPRGELPFEPPPVLSVPHPPFEPVPIADPPLTHPADRQPSQFPQPGIDPPFMPAPPPSVPAVLPPEPAPPPSVPAVLPPPPSVVLSVPATLPAEPAPPHSVPAQLPPPPTVDVSHPGTLPPPPEVVLSAPAVLPDPPAVVESAPAQLPPPPDVQVRHPSALPPPQDVVLSVPSPLPDPPKVTNFPTVPAAAQPSLAISPSAQPAGIRVPGPDQGGPVEPIFHGTINDFLDGLPGAQVLGPLARAAENILGVGPIASAPLMQTVGAYLVGADFTKNATVGGLALQGAQKVAGPYIQGLLMGQRNVNNPGDGLTSDGPETAPTVFDQQNPAWAGPDAISDALLGDSPIPTYVTKDSLEGRPRLNSAALWNPRPTDSLLSGIGGSGEQRPIRQAALANLPEKLVRSAFSRGVIPVRFAEDNAHGFVTFRNGDDRLPVDDDDAYVPLSFTDLRPVGNIYRTVYFRPMITSMTEDFQSDWNLGQYFGRVDAVASYKATGRTITLAFQLVAFAPDDVRAIYQKLAWLNSMIYPEYDAELMYRSGPVVRMRVGDVINAVGPEGSRGLPGIIQNLSYDYSDSIWEIQKDFKVPRHVKVSISFLVLHDTPIGRGEEGRFGGIGSFVDGVYVPPGAGDQSAGGDGSLRLAKVEQGMSSFRSVGGTRANELVNYEGTMQDLFDTQPIDVTQETIDKLGGNG